MIESNTENLSNKALVITTCPISKFGNYFVVASSTANKEQEHFLKFYKFDPQMPEDPIKILAYVKTTIPFTAIAWTKLGEEEALYSYGLIIGGHYDGTLTIWDVNAILTAKDSKIKQNFGLVQSQKLLNSSVYAIKFNVKPNIFAVGSKEISIMSIEVKNNLTITIPVRCPAPEEGGFFTSLSWNEKVNHILAAATTTGMTYIWDMKRKELFLTICDQSLVGEDEVRKEGVVNTSILWCSDGAQVIIAYDDPEYNFLTQYHMKQPNAPSAEYHQGHSSSIIDIVKNPYDTNFLLSLGRDNVVACWSMRSQKPLVHVQLSEKCSQIIWMSKTPDCFISVGFDGSIHYHRVNFSQDISSFNENSELPPKWLNKRAGVSFSFGGKFVTFAEKLNSMLNVYKLAGNKTLVETMKNFIEKVEKSDLTEILDEKIFASQNLKNNISIFWVTLKCLYTRNFNELFTYMGYDKNKLESDIAGALGKTSKTDIKKKKKEIITAKKIEVEEDPEVLFNKPSVAVESTKTEHKDVTAFEKPNTIQETYTRNINWNVGSEKLIKQSLLIGELESAVEIAFKNNRSAEALLIASCDPDLFQKAKQMYFSNNKDLFVKSIFPAIINKNFDSLFDYNVVKEWKEYILYAKTYLGESDSFVTYANQLGDKLSSNPDIYTSIICYVLAEKYDKCIELLYNNYAREIERVGREEKKYILQSLFEQIVALHKVLSIDSRHNNSIYNKIIYDYCEQLIEEGLIVEASRYLINIRDNNNAKVLQLYDRLYYHSETQLSKNLTKPACPYNIMTIKPKLEKVATQTGKTGKLVKNATTSLFDTPVEERKGSKPQVGIDNKPIITSARTPMPVQIPSTKITKGPFVEKPNIPESPIIQEPEIPKGGLGKVPFKPVNAPKPDISKLHNINPPVITSPPIQPPVQPSNTGRTIIQPPRPVQKSPISSASNNATPNIISQPISSQVQTSQTPTITSTQQAMNMEEESVHTYFEKMIDVYNSVYQDENKQKDFAAKISVLLGKLKNHEIKPNLLKMILDFMNLYDNAAPVSDLKKLYMKIQSCEWDKNKSWMPLLERTINMPRK